MNYYELLEVSPKASQEVLKAAYRSIIQRYHPDRNPGDAAAAEHSILVNRAYEVLSNPDQRAAYDIELARQSEKFGFSPQIARSTAYTTSADDSESESRWTLWMQIVLVIIFIWFIWFAFVKKSPAVSQSGTGSSLIGNVSAEFLHNKAGERPIAATKSIPVYLKDINVALVIPAESAGGTPGNIRPELSIQTLGVVVGVLDPDKAISFLENNKEYIGQKLTEKLASAKYAQLLSNNGEKYLKAFVLNAIGEITGDSSVEHGADPNFQYGAIDVLLPDSFLITLPVLPPQ